MFHEKFKKAHLQRGCACEFAFLQGVESVGITTTPTVDEGHTFASLHIHGPLWNKGPTPTGHNGECAWIFNFGWREKILQRAMFDMHRGEVHSRTLPLYTAIANALLRQLTALSEGMWQYYSLIDVKDGVITNSPSQCLIRSLEQNT